MFSKPAAAIQAAPPAQGRPRISLAAALFGFSAAAGYAEPYTCETGPWLSHFVRKHADGAVYAGLFPTCRGGRDWSLQFAPTATFTLDTTERLQPDAWLARVLRRRDALIARGSLPTRLVIRGTDSKHSRAAMTVVLAQFQGHTAAISDITLQSAMVNMVCTAFSDLLPLVAQVIPHLTTLTLSPAIPTLPPTNAFPQLTSINVSLRGAPAAVVNDCLRSCARYLPQITSLSIDDYAGGGEPHWSLLFNPASTSNTLTTFTTSKDLTNTLVRLLVQHAPVLERLSVPRVRLNGDHSDRTWAVRALCLGADHAGRDLVFLPTCEKGDVVITIKHALAFAISRAQDISQSFLARCPEWRFNLREVTVRAMGDQGTNVDTLRTTLSQLHVNLRVVGPWYDLSGYQHRDAQQGLLSAADAAAEGAALCLAGWVSQAPMLRTYAYFTPRFRDLGLRLSMPYAVSLDPGLLFAAVQEAAHLGCLAVKEVDLPSQYVMNTWMDWPWDELHVDKLEALHMLRLPDPGHEGAPWAVCCGEMHLHKWTCEYMAGHVCDRLYDIRWRGCAPEAPTLVGPQAASELPMRIILHCDVEGDTAEQLDALKAQLMILQSMRFSGVDVEPGVLVCLKGYTFTHEFIRALAGLPDWAAWLDLSECRFPFEHTAEYRSLAQHVPTAYTGWVLPGQPRVPAVESIMQGIIECKARFGPEPVTLVLPKYTGNPLLKRKCVLVVSKAHWADLREHGMELCLSEPNKYFTHDDMHVSVEVS